MFGIFFHIFLYPNPTTAMARLSFLKNINKENKLQSMIWMISIPIDQEK
jgi:hypothetical protein